jgi:hypothetical protein
MSLDVRIQICRKTFVNKSLQGFFTGVLRIIQNRKKIDINRFKGGFDEKSKVGVGLFE